MSSATTVSRTAPTLSSFFFLRRRGAGESTLVVIVVRVLVETAMQAILRCHCGRGKITVVTRERDHPHCLVAVHVPKSPFVQPMADEENLPDSEF